MTELLKKEIYELFRESLSHVIREEEAVYGVLENKENIFIEKRDENSKLIGVSVIHKNVILLLCVAPEYRRQGIGTWLLNESEKAIRTSGYDEITVGAGEDYITPGIPTSKRYAPAVNERLDEHFDETASSFFEKRGYVHDWGNESNCFDMKFPLSEFSKKEHSIGDTIDGVCYRFATPKDREQVFACTDAACEEFTRWYKEESLYTENKSSRVLVAVTDGKVVGTLMVDTDHKTSLGSVGCTAVHPDYRGRHIAVNMVMLGTKYLQDVGMKDAYLGYTYTGLDHMYGYAGYKILVYFMMAKKKFYEIRKIEKKDLEECVNVIRDSFATVAKEFDITPENAPRYTAFATDERRLDWHLNGEHRPMFGYFRDGKIAGYFSLLWLDNGECELNNLAVLPEYRHAGIGARLLEHAFEAAKEQGCTKVKIGIVEENQVLRKWYESFGFVHVGTQKFEFFPFTCGYMEKLL